ncbi:zinc finger, CCHC-type containing protein [Tanacetum coccineum]
MIDDMPCSGIDMVIKDLDLEPKINAMTRDFLEQVLETSPCFEKRFTMILLEHQDVISEFGSSSRWEKLSKETGSEILPSGDGSRGLESVECTSVLHQPDDIGSQRHHIVPFGELNGVSIALVAWSGIISESAGKMKVDGTIEKFKARLVIEEFKQKSGIDYFDTYAPVARISSIRLLIALALIHNLITHQMDVKTTFLNGELDEEVYMNKLRLYHAWQLNKVELTKEFLLMRWVET